ncbi:carboxypeptidase B-like [Tachypleus tridentatus]|uniref:carboxypeptidase B-like n=1 Tax=Tachypleus tridentatus TaxID=6853 RepID=UPI003FD50679
MRMFALSGWSLLCAILVVTVALPPDGRVDYTGYKVIRVVPEEKDQTTVILNLRQEYQVDLWNEPYYLGVPVLIRVAPGVAQNVESKLMDANLPFTVVYEDLQSVVQMEYAQNKPQYSSEMPASSFSFGIYHTLEEIYAYIQNIASANSNIATTMNIGNTYENRPILGIKISGGSSSNKPVIFLEFGIHSREWVSTATGVWIINELITKYSTDRIIKELVDTYEWQIIPSANPDGYSYTWTNDRMWRKTRSKSKNSMFWCRGADPNRNFDVDFCGAGTSRDPCSEIYCGDAPFSETEARAIRDAILAVKSRIKAYFGVHSFSQLWMIPYGYTSALPHDYNNLMRISKAGVDAIYSVHRTSYKYGPIATIIYKAAGSSLDWTYDKAGVKVGFALELRDTGRYGFLLPKEQIIPTAEETWAGIQASIKEI